MKKPGMLLCLLLLFPAPIFAGSYQNSATPANDCEGAAKACSAAAKELAAARRYIEGLNEQIAASDERIAIALNEIAVLKQIGVIQGERARELEKVIAAERDQVAILLKLKAEQEKRLVILEKRLGRARKFALIAGVAAGVAILIGANK
jgi:hypothetical protein